MRRDHGASSASEHSTTITARPITAPVLARKERPELAQGGGGGPAARRADGGSAIPSTSAVIAACRMRGLMMP